MTNRIEIPITLGAEPAGRIHVLPLTKSRWVKLQRGEADPLDPAAKQAIAQLGGLVRFEAKPGQDLPVSVGDGVLLLLIGLGEEVTSRGLRNAAAFATSRTAVEEAWSLIVPEPEGQVDGSTALRAMAEGVALGPYRFKRTDKPAPKVAGPCRIVSHVPGGEALLARSLALVEGMLLTRDLVNTPADDLGPGELSDTARESAERHGMRVSVLSGDEVEKRGFRLVHAVGRAASRPSTVTVVENFAEGAKPELAVVGKGVVFDTGGLDIKTSGYMQLMRKDMGGAGTVIGALEALGRIGSKAPFMMVLPAAENSIGPLSMRPSDVFRAYDGQTVEIGNTDAEGRLLLADGLAYSRERGAARLLDVATLTGAARVALGPDVPALFGTDDELVALLERESRKLDEMLWRMPLVESYDATLDSPFADMNNASSDRRGGAITAALFLKRFAKDTPWAHIDLYAWEDRGRPGTPRGGNGMTVRTLVEAIESLPA